MLEEALILYCRLGCLSPLAGRVSSSFDIDGRKSKREKIGSNIYRGSWKEVFEPNKATLLYRGPLLK
jgi:hypothetical protein